MIQTTTQADTPRFALPDHAVVALAGRDALAFVQAQAMNDVAALADGQWQWNGWLTPKGRVVALFAALRLDGETAWLLVPDGGAATLADALRRYVFRSKVTIALRGDLHVSAAFEAPRAASGARLDGNDDVGIELDLGGDGGSRTLRIDPLPAPADAAALARWRAFDLAHGVPRLTPDQRERWTPQQLSLERLRAFSVAKGCYPGQEIVARTHFLGQAKRGLMRLAGAGVHALDEVMELAPGDEPAAIGRPVGQVVCAAGDEGLAVLPRDIGSAALATGGAPCTPLVLLEGLAR